LQVSNFAHFKTAYRWSNLTTMDNTTKELNEFVAQVKMIQQLKKTIRADIDAWEHTLKGKSELTAAQKKTLRSTLLSAKRQVAVSKKGA
jgi:hypothetical protein